MFTGSDFPFLYEIAINCLNIYPILWSNVAGNGLGQNISFILGLNSFFIFLIKPLEQLTGLSWYLVEKIVFLIPYFILSALSAYVFSSIIFKKKLLKIIAAIIYATNTYALMIVGGGQFGVAIAYSITPLVLYFTLRVLTEKKSSFISNNLLIAVLIFSFQLLIDPRLALITLFAAVIFYLVNAFLNEINARRFFEIIIITICALFINSFWILPFIFSKDLNLATAYTSGEIASFFSFAKLENTFSLIHPNYPENIFGKVSFLKFEYLILPIIAFSGLFFIYKLKKEKAAFFLSLSLIAIVGIFLAKGVNYPLGEIYGFILNNIPFATIYRDPMKFYLLITLSFSVLIPWSIMLTGNLIKKKFGKRNILSILIVFFIIFWIFSIRHLFILGSGGVLKPVIVDEEYISFAQEFKNKNEFSRIFSLPTKQRFIYTSQMNPVINANDFYDEYDHGDLIKIIESNNFIDDMKNLSVEYIVVPYDQESKIFLEDRKYSPELFDKYVKALYSRKDVTQLEEYKKVKIFKVDDFKDLIWSDNSGVSIKYNMLSPVEYELNIQGVEEATKITLNQSYSPNWLLIGMDGGGQVAKKYNNINIFEVQEDGKYKIYYKSQSYVNLGLIISFISLGTLIILICINLVKKRKK